MFINEAINITFEKPPLFQLYYMLYLAHNLTDIIYLLFVYEKQTDFPLMFMHHSCTISLVFFSHHTNLSNIGANVMVTHDIVDILVYYMRSIINTDVRNIVKTIMGFALLSVYFYTRLFIFGKLIITCYQHNIYGWNMVFSVLWHFMCFLYMIHLYWIYLISKKIYVAIFKGFIDDTASFKKQLDKNI